MSRPHGPPCPTCSFGHDDVADGEAPYDIVTGDVATCPRCGTSYVRSEDADDDEGDPSTVADGSTISPDEDKLKRLKARQRQRDSTEVSTNGGTIDWSGVKGVDVDIDDAKELAEQLADGQIEYTGEIEIDVDKDDIDDIVDCIHGDDEDDTDTDTDDDSDEVECSHCMRTWPRRGLDNGRCPVCRAYIGNGDDDD